MSNEDTFTMDIGLTCSCEECLNAIVSGCTKCGAPIAYCEYWGEFVEDPLRIMTEEICEGITPV